MCTQRSATLRSVALRCAWSADDRTTLMSPGWTWIVGSTVLANDTRQTNALETCEDPAPPLAWRGPARKAYCWRRCIEGREGLVHGAGFLTVIAGMTLANYSRNPPLGPRQRWSRRQWERRGGGSRAERERAWKHGLSGLTWRVTRGEPTLGLDVELCCWDVELPR